MWHHSDVDGRSPKRVRQLAVVVLIVVVVFGLIEAAVRARESVLPPPPRWVGPEMPLKERQVLALERGGGASVMFVGSSVVDVSIDPSEMRRMEDRPLYNASTGAASLAMISTWTRLLATPKLRPDVAVVGIISRELNPNDPEQRRLDRQFAAAPAVRELVGNETLAQKFERNAQQLSALVRYRALVRQPKYVLQMLGLKEAASGEYGALVAPDGQYRGFLNREYPDPATLRRLFAQGALSRFDVGPAQLESLRRLLTHLAGHVERVIVVNMPVTSDYVDAHPNGEDDYRRATEALEGASDAAGARFVDMGVWPAVYFADPAHLNARGSERITSMLDEVLAQDV